MGISYSYTPLTDRELARFWSNVVKSDGCWMWRGFPKTIFSKGELRNVYPTFWANGRNFRANRASWQIHFGEIPDGLFVCHTCDTPGCVRPDHLFLGTNARNMADMRMKKRGTWPKGERHFNAKLTESLVREIHRLRADGLINLAIAVKVGCSRTNVNRILNGKAWRHVQPLQDAGT